MVTVSALLSDPVFEGFRISAGDSGLNKPVLSTGYFEWEQDTDIVKSFGKGEFVVTTLYAAKDDTAFAEKCLKLLINNQVAAIAIKDIYYDDISAEMKSYADKYGVPIMFFSETYIDDIIVTVRNGLRDEFDSRGNDAILNSLIFDKDLSSLEREALMRRLNAFFYSETVFAAYISRDDDISDISAGPMSCCGAICEELKKTIPTQINDAAFVHSFLEYKRGFFLLSTCNSSEDEISHIFTGILRNKYFKHELLADCRIGVAAPVHGFAHISDLLLEAIYANVSCTLDKRDIMEFRETGTDRLIIAYHHTAHYRKFYDETLRSLTSAESRRSHLLETLLAFVEYGGNVEAAAEALCTHKNTIRYRIGKINALLGAEDEISLYNSMHIFSRLHNSRKYLDVFFRSGSLDR